MGDWQHAFIKILFAAGASKPVCACLEGLPTEAGVGRLELILMRKKPHNTTMRNRYHDF
jgi:hypothetical protein